MNTETHVTITPEHTDILGHLNHVAAVRLLERARSDWYRACGLFPVEPERYGPVVVNIDYDYRRECFEGEALRIVTRPVARGTKSFVLEHEVYKPDGTVAVAGRATSVIMDMQAREIVPVPECLARHLPPRAQG
ncbi:MAG: acyl-CoA thioesterase [Ectothiorhodospiraceae bacterium]|nr:acyl-CoA thioesterase [Chromatiales bacterium]MCP5155668.1 acyl-CoA thioesterase [Ectothiorhodospiraceae bacterium]